MAFGLILSEEKNSKIYLASFTLAITKCQFIWLSKKINSVYTLTYKNSYTDTHTNTHTHTHKLTLKDSQTHTDTLIHSHNQITYSKSLTHTHLQGVGHNQQPTIFTVLS